MLNYRNLLAGSALAIVALASTRAGAGVDEGRALYDKHCKACHSIAGEGGRMKSTGGPLDGLASKRDETWLREFVADPKSKVPKSMMTKLSLSDQQLDDLIGYLLSLK